MFFILILYFSARRSRQVRYPHNKCGSAGLTLEAVGSCHNLCNHSSSLINNNTSSPSFHSNNSSNSSSRSNWRPHRIRIICCVSLFLPWLVVFLVKKNMRTQHWLYFKIIEYRSADSNNKKYIFNNIYQWIDLVDTLIAYISQCQSSMYILKYDYFGYTKLCKNLINL